MNKLKKIYYPILAVASVLLIAFAFVTTKVGVWSTDADVDAVRKYATTITDAGSHDIFDDSSTSVSSGNRGAVVSAIGKELRTIISSRYSALYNDGGNTVTLSTATSGSSVRTMAIGKYTESTDDGSEEKTELAPVFYSNTVRLSAADVAKIPCAAEKGIMEGQRVQNIILYVPGENSKESVIFSMGDITKFTLNSAKLEKSDAIAVVTHYDSTIVDPGYVSNGVAIGSAIALFEEIVSEQRSFKNDIVFIFTDAHYSSEMGANAFMYADGYSSVFNNVRSRIKSIAYFDSVGDASTFVLSDVNVDGSGVASAVAGITAGAGSSSFAGFVHKKVSGTDALSPFDGIGAVSFLGIGDQKITSSADISDVAIRNVSGLMNRYVSKVGNLDGSRLTNGVNAAFFDYLGLTIWYADYAAYVVGGIIILLLAAVVTLAVLKKTYSLQETGKGAAVSALSVLASAVVMCAVTLLSTLALFGFGVLDIHGIFSVVTSSLPVFLIALALGLTLTVVFNGVFKKIFAVKTPAIVRGNALIVALLGAVLSFACPDSAYLFGFVGLLSGIALLVNILCKQAFKNKYGKDIERLLLAGVAALLALPVLISDALVVYGMTNLYLLPLYLAAILLPLQSVLPFLGSIRFSCRKKAAQQVDASKMEEKTEQNASDEKKAKAVVVVPVLTSLVAFVAVICLGAFGYGADGRSNLQSRFDGYEQIYDNAIVYEYETKNGEVNQNFLIKDLDLYAYLKNAQGFDWCSNKKAYALKDDTSAQNIPVIGSEDRKIYDQLASNANMFTFNNRIADDAKLTVTFKVANNSGKISKIRVLSSLGAYSTTVNMDTARYTEFAVNGTEFTVDLPAGYGIGLAIEVFGEGKINESLILDVTTTEYLLCGTLNNMGDIGNVGTYNSGIAALQTEYSNDPLADNIFVNLIYKHTAQVSVKA